MWMWYVCCFIVAVAILRYHLLRWHLYKLSWSMYGPISLPIIGDAMKIPWKNEDIFDSLQKLMASYSSPIKIWLGPKFVIIFTDVNHIKKIVSSMKCLDKDEIYRFMKPFTGEGLISGSGPKWKSDRKLLTSLFSDTNIIRFMPVIVREAGDLIRNLESKVDLPTFDCKHIVHRSIAHIINTTLSGVPNNFLPEAEFEQFLDTVAKMYIMVHSRMAKPWLRSDFIFKLTGLEKQQEEGLNIIHGFFRKCLTNAKLTYKGQNFNENGTTSILHEMLAIQDRIPNFATDEEIIHHLVTFYTAGEDTIMNICGFTLVLWGMHPDIQEKAAKEVRDVVGPHNRDLTLEDMKLMKYTEMCIKEVLRLFPIGPFLMRKTTADCEIDRWKIPEGCSVLISIFHLQRDPQLWERPTEFYPEHFLPEAVNKRHPYAYLPFSAGPRGCVGKPFANMVIKIILATILLHYRIEADGTLQEKKLKADITVRFKDDTFPIRLKKRQH